MGKKKGKKKAQSPGLPSRQFNKMLTALKTGMKRITANAEKAIRGLLERHSASLAKCNQLQLQLVEDTLHAGSGLQMRDAVRKAVLLGSGRLANHVYWNKGVTWQKFIGFAARKANKLNDPNHEWVIQTSRNKRIRKKSKDLTTEEAQVLTCRWRQPDVLPASRQRDPRVKPMHQYYRLVHVEADKVVRRSVIATFRLGNSQFKSRLSFGDVSMITAALPAAKKKKRVRV